LCVSLRATAGAPGWASIGECGPARHERPICGAHAECLMRPSQVPAALPANCQHPLARLNAPTGWPTTAGLMAPSFLSSSARPAMAAPAWQRLQTARPPPKRAKRGDEHGRWPKTARVSSVQCPGSRVQVLLCVCLWPRTRMAPAVVASSATTHCTALHRMGPAYPSGAGPPRRAFHFCLCPPPFLLPLSSFLPLRC
jgi:hypothetical protein